MESGGHWKLLGRSASIQSIRQDLERVLPRLAAGRRVPTILLQGETGTGKGLLARTIHESSPRADGPFVDLNCAAIPATLIEAELFGFERGAFTDARQARTGLIQAAHGGTLFLDEVALLPESLQAKLLTVLDSREVRPLGATRARPVDVLVVAATNADLRTAVRERQFREDLYHRLSVLVFALPPLRERGDDVLELAQALLARACADHGVAPKALAADARRALGAYPWPGNVRELANLMDRVALLSEGAAVTAADLELPDAVGAGAASGPAAPAEDAPAPRTPLRASIDTFTRARMEEVLRETRGNVSAAADRLGVPRSTLRYQLERLDMAPEREGRGAARPPLPERPLAERILATPGTVAGERKQVTVLFADFADVRARLSAHEPAAATALLEPLMGHAIEAVRRHGGTVNQIRGDGIMALFGAPLALEDHAVRACSAALAIHEPTGADLEALLRAVPGPLPVRVGLHSGDVVLRVIGTETRLDYAAIPDTTLLAARMEQAARGGSSVLSAATLQLAEGFVEVAPTGLADAFELRAPSAVRSRLAAAIARGLTRFVGRAAETVQVLAAMDRADGRRGQIVALVGEPGVGKSRIAWEVARVARGEGWLVLETGTAAASKAPAWAPLAGLLRAYFEIEPHAEPGWVRGRVLERLATLEASSRLLAVPLLAILDVPVNDAEWERREARDRRQRMLDAALRLVLAASRPAPLLLLVDDLQWIDSESQTFLDLLVESLPAARVLLLVSYRPEGEHHWSGRTTYTQIRVDPLAATDARELLDGLVGADHGLDALKRLLIERTQGNPFFLEESVWALVETGVLVGERGAYRQRTPLASVEVPATVHAVLAARIDRLPPEGRGLLHAAAAIGMDVPLPLLRVIADLDEASLRRGLAHLQAAELLYQTRLFPEREYTFKHALTHDVAYGSLLPERRRALHARIVEAIEQRYAGRLDEHLGRLAHHAVAGEVWDLAVDYLRRAAAAVTRVAYGDAAAYYEQALEALRRLPEHRERREQAVDLHFELALCRYATGQFDRAMAAYQEAERRAVALGDDHRVARVCTGLAYLLGSEADHHGSIAAGERALSLASRVDDPALMTWASVGMAREYFAIGDFPRAIERARAALDPGGSVPPGARPRNLPTPVGARTWLALCLAARGQFDEAITWAQAAIELADKVDEPLPQVWASYTLGRILALRGHFVPALGVLERAAALLERGSFPIYAPRVLAALGTVYRLTGRVAPGLALLERAVAEGEAHRVLYEHAMVVIQRGTAHLDGDIERAHHDATQAVELACRHGERGSEAWALRLLGRVLAVRPRGSLDKAVALAGQALALAQALDMRPLVVRCHQTLGELARHTGQAEQAREHLDAVSRLSREMTLWLGPDPAPPGSGRPA